MPVPAVERKLAAIFAADIAGYSRLTGLDEAGTLARLKARREIMDRLIAAYRGRIFNTAGDSVVADFASAVDAVQCAVAVQEALGKDDAGVAESEAMRFRIGIHVGDVIVEGTNLFGDAVNIAARLEAVAEPGGVCVSATVRDQIGSKLPVGFIDLGEQQVKNIVQPIRVYRVKPEGPLPNPPPLAGEGSARSARVGAEPPVLPLPDKPSIAVLPFQNMSGDPEQEYFADGMVEEIITALSRIRWLFVIARNSSFTYKGQAIDVKQVGRELGVRYVLEGSVRKAAGRVRITAQLIDATNGTHLWADRFDGALEDVFELQDSVAISVAGVIEPTLHAAEMARSAEGPTTDLTAYDLYLRAYALAFSWEKSATIRSLELLDQAIERDPRYGSALAQAAARHFELHVNGWTNDPETSRRKGIELSRQALQVAGDDTNVLCNVGYILGYFGEEIDVAIALLDHGLRLNPSSARGWQWSGWLRAWAGKLEQAIEHFETSLRLNPREQRANPLMGIGVAHFFAGRLEEARAALLRSLQEKPNWVPTYRFLASCYAHMGRLDEAREVVRRLRTLTNVLVPSAENWRDPEHREFYLSGLRLAAGEAG